MQKQTCPYKIGDKLIFAPEERAIGLNWASLDYWGIYPGKILTIEHFTEEGGIRMYAEEPGGFLCNQFIPFKENEKCPFEIGDVVRFTPSERTKAGFDFLNRYSLLKLGKEYEVRKIINDVWIFVDFDIWGFYWKDFTLVSKAKEKYVLSNKTIGQLVGEILSLLDKSKPDEKTNFWLDSLNKDFKKLEVASSFKEKWGVFDLLENSAMGGSSRMIYLHLTPKENANLNEEDLNKRYSDLVYELYWSARLEKEKFYSLVRR